jgi:hypothetical protein
MRWCGRCYTPIPIGAEDHPIVGDIAQGTVVERGIPPRPREKVVVVPDVGSAGTAFRTAFKLTVTALLTVVGVAGGWIAGRSVEDALGITYVLVLAAGYSGLAFFVLRGIWRPRRAPVRFADRGERVVRVVGTEIPRPPERVER